MLPGELSETLGGFWRRAEPSVEPADVPKVVAALGGADGDDVLALLGAAGERIIGDSEQAWLRGLGIEPGFWSRVGEEL